MLHRIIILIGIGLCAMPAWSQPSQAEGNGLAYPFAGMYGQVEVGGMYAGAEFHDSRPLPSRVSMYYPVANSIDLSTDYWKRGDSRPFVVGVKTGRGPRRWLGKEAWPYVVSPHRVVFRKADSEFSYTMAYEFCRTEPAMVFRLVLRNVSGSDATAEVYTHLKMSLRTCQTYARLDSSWTSIDTLNRALGFHFGAIAADHASLFVQNAGVEPALWSTDALRAGIADSGWSAWLRDSSGVVNGKCFPRGEEGNAAAIFLYTLKIPAGDSLEIVQAIGSARYDEVPPITARLLRGWHAELAANDSVVSADHASIKTGERNVDKSARWAQGILASNRHYIDSALVPMPCPAEYNFFFTHDVLLTDLGAVSFDCDRVRRDLQYVASLARDSVIPHAYYWRDNGFKTEFCTPDNWNHLWFILTTGSYLRHSLDTATVNGLLPLVSKSLSEMLTQKGKDNLMHAFRPDWWDIGRAEGSRSFITILTIRALREYVYMSAMLGRNGDDLGQHEILASSMELALDERLWSDEQQFLVNFNGERVDRHYYMGSLLGPVYGVMDNVKASQMVRTASRYLVAPSIGVRTVWPVDFNTDSAKAFFKFVGNEAGDPFTYANGGVWPHANAFYTMALKNVGRTEDAFGFFKQIMTMDGVMKSPQGLPAMYEYRYSNPSSPEYGRIDKPSFLWAGGFYLQTLYRLMGVDDNVWNVSIGNETPRALESSSYALAFDARKTVHQSGTGLTLRGVRVGNQNVPSRVLPLSARSDTVISLTRGVLKTAYLESVTAILDSAHQQADGRLLLTVRSFPGHTVVARVRALTPGKLFLADGTTITDVIRERQEDGTFMITMRFPGTRSPQHIEVFFSPR